MCHGNCGTGNDVPRLLGHRECATVIGAHGMCHDNCGTWNDVPRLLGHKECATVIGAHGMCQVDNRVSFIDQSWY